MNICSFKGVINMPGFDGTGPLGYGPRTGRGMGPCGLGLARGRGYGRGFGRRFYYSPSKKEEMEILEEDSQVLKEELGAIEDRIKELKGSK